jgi:hypothetical protein
LARGATREQREVSTLIEGRNVLGFQPPDIALKKRSEIVRLKGEFAARIDIHPCGYLNAATNEAMREPAHTTEEIDSHDSRHVLLVATHAGRLSGRRYSKVSMYLVKQSTTSLK